MAINSNLNNVRRGLEIMLKSGSQSSIQVMLRHMNLACGIYPVKMKKFYIVDASYFQRTYILPIIKGGISLFNQKKLSDRIEVIPLENTKKVVRDPDNLPPELGGTKGRVTMKKPSFVSHIKELHRLRQQAHRTFTLEGIDIPFKGEFSPHEWGVI